jgi:prevent-host-death family protein
VKTVSLLEFRKKAQTVLAYVQKGQGVLLTYRGKPVARLEPLANRSVGQEDPFYSLDRLADPRGVSLTNDEIDRVIYGP